MSAERVHELLERLGNLLRGEARAIDGPAGLQPVHVQALAFLARANRYSDTPAAVADFLGLTKGTVSQTLAVLLERDLVRRQPDAKDRRKVHLQPTAKGRRLLQRLPPEPLVQGLAATGDANALAAMLDRLLAAMLRARGGRTFGVCRTCRHFRALDRGFQCGLTGEPLLLEATGRICREHAAAD